MNEQKTIESNSPECKKEGLLQLHKGILDSMRKREGDTFKFITTLIGGSILPAIPYFFKGEANNLYLWYIPFCIISIFIFWWGSYFILTLSYQYRNLQRGVTEIQLELELFDILPKEWNIFEKETGKSKLKEVLTEFYKPHFYGFVIGEILIFLISIIISLNAFINSSNNYCCFEISSCCHIFISFIFVFLILLLLFLSIFSIFYKKCHYEKKIMNWSRESHLNKKKES